MDRARERCSIRERWACGLFVFVWAKCVSALGTMQGAKVNSDTDPVGQEDGLHGVVVLIINFVVLE